MTNNLCVILGDQLSLNVSSLKNFKKDQDRILMMEVFNEAEYANHHKKKLVLIFSAMRHFAEELQTKGFSVKYSKINESQNDFTKELEFQSKKIKPKRIVITHPGEYRVLQEVKKWEKVLRIPVSILEDDRFFCSIDEFEKWTEGRKELRMELFYQMMRKKYDILIDKNGKPKGGKWNYDIKNRKSLPKNYPRIPEPLEHKPDNITKQVIIEVKKKFPKHFGDLEPFWFAVTHIQAMKNLNDFLKNKLDNFGPYEDAMAQEESFLYHSVLSMYLNIGLLEPKQIIKKVLEKDGIKVESIEGFVRQILGWREYIRGIYWHTMPSYSKTNYFDAKNKLPKFYWTGDTEMNCMKNCIQQTIKESYAHHIQRLMITGNFALIAGIKPEEVCEWYLSVYADAYEWVELPNTHGMTLYADGGILGSKPYAASGNYINKMSNYCRDCKYNVKEKEGKDACPFNYLYWNFFLENQNKLQKNPRLWTVFSNIKKMSSAKKKQIQNDSKKFLIQISK
tara:strand:+ start:1333 stop:2853 length:1521 start_codon:yes stop_codon:yes gene_type:complete